LFGTVLTENSKTETETEKSPFWGKIYNKNINEYATTETTSYRISNTVFKVLHSDNVGPGVA